MAERKFDRPDLLSSMAWLALTQEARIQLAANKFILDEKKIEKKYKRYDGPTAGNVKAYLSSLFIIPRGQAKSTVEGVLKAIGPQKAIREKRQKLSPEKFIPPSQQKRAKRLNRISLSLYCIYDSDGDRRSNNAVSITTLNGCLVIMDAGSYNTLPRLYLRQKATGRVKVVVLDKQAKSLSGALLLMSRKSVYRGMYDGKKVLLDFYQEGFLLDGELVPWQHVRKVYRGVRAARRTERHPVDKKKKK